jgi:hypothetical protein
MKHGGILWGRTHKEDTGNSNPTELGPIRPGSYKDGAGVNRS